MKATIKILFTLGASAILSSCANVGYISENDVYMQAPTELNLEEDENDITSFNAYKASQKGAFQQEYQDPRVNQRVRMNTLMIMSLYPRYGYFYNSPYGYYGMGYNHPNMYGYRGFNSGIGFGGYHSQYYYGYSPFGYGYGYSPYHNGGYYGYYGGHYGSYYGNGYYGNDYYGGSYNGNGNSGAIAQGKKVFQGPRRSPISNSNRSSYYSIPKSAVSVYTQKSKSGMSKSAVVMSRDIQKRKATGSDYSFKSREVVRSSDDRFGKQERYRAPSAMPTQRNVVNSAYTPSTSSRVSGTVRAPSRSNVNVQQSRSASPNRSSSPRSASPRSTTRTAPSSPRMQQTPSSGRSVSPASRSGSSNRTSSPSSRRR
ncbi:hypothetical protein [Brumimicrobium oceani]|uniref:Vitellogenin II n=1 Tax=Brumimicrobium oceani TaxID=2100725 RepID=A0A2U2XE50_9FLAO|nr:hypothetical protein [Brumimicrobium oceani]PWH86086.1 hypothetical protein DIT68_05890 [Brumimicrobium oceani]